MNNLLLCISAEQLYTDLEYMAGDHRLRIDGNSMMEKDLNTMNIPQQYAEQQSNTCIEACAVDTDAFETYGVKRGLRDKDGRGVVAGITTISMINAFDEKEDGQRIPIPGKLFYRGYDVIDLIKGAQDRNGFVFEEAAYLLLFGKLPNENELTDFNSILGESRTLPTNFVRDVIMKAPSNDMMNTLARSVLTMASYENRTADLSISNVLRQCIKLISIFPMLAVYGYHAYNHYECDESLYIHRPDKNLSTAENILMMLRPDKQFTELEAKVLDIALLLHMEHGGGNNSTFTTRVVSSAGSDTYSVIAAALCSLKGPKHGGANIKVVEMMRDLKETVADIQDEEQIKDYLNKLLHKEAFDKKGLIYGMGHAIYSVSDPRALVFENFVKKLALEKGRQEDYELYSKVARLGPELITKDRTIYKGVCVNVDFYSGFVYSMLGISGELYTPIFAMARIAGWSAHRLEELITANKIMRPAYQAVVTTKDYVPLEKR